MKIFPCFDWCIAHGGLWGRCFATLGVDFIHGSYILLLFLRRIGRGKVIKRWEREGCLFGRGVIFGD